jgi:hypothetical protein
MIFQEFTSLPLPNPPLAGAEIPFHNFGIRDPAFFTNNQKNH